MATTSQEWKKLIFFGDSLTQFGWSHDGGWISEIADKYQRKFDVICRGFSGYNTKWCNIILPQLFNKGNLEDVELFVIFLGANDSNLKNINSRQAVPLNEFTLYLSNMVLYLMSSGVKSQKILIISVPPVDEEKWSLTMEAKGDVSGKRLQLCEEYSEVCRSVSLQFNTLFLDLYRSMMVHPDWKSFLCDGLHFSRQGSLFLATKVTELIEAKVEIPQIRYPLWSDVDNVNPHMTLI